MSMSKKDFIAITKMKRERMNTMQLLNRQSFAVNHFASKEESRYILKGILVTKNETVATDGHVLARVSHPKLVEIKNYPSVPGFTPNGTPDKFILPLDTATAIAKSIPRKQPVPILNYAAFSASGETGEGQVAVTDLDRPQVFGVKALTGQFPNWQMVIPTDNGSKGVETAVDVALLKRIVQGLEEFSKGKRLAEVRIRVKDASSPIRFDAKNDEGQNMTALLMPLRMGGGGYEELDKEVSLALVEHKAKVLEDAKKPAKSAK